MITHYTIDFLNDLKANNNREWFQANRKRYEKVRTEVDGLMNQMIPEIAAMDPSIGLPDLKDCAFRINRDIRFSPDKSPYKTHFGVFVAKGGRKSIYPGYYVHIEPGSSLLAGGIYMPQPEVLKLIRQEVYFNADEFVKILSEKHFRKLFGELDPFDKMKKPPRDFPADFPHIDLLKYRSYTVVHALSDDQVLSGDFVAYSLSVFRAMLPLHTFLRRAIEQG